MYYTCTELHLEGVCFMFSFLVAWLYYYHLGLTSSIYFQGILSHKLDHFYQMCQLEMTFSCQSYMTLLVTCLKNAVQRLVSSQSR
jgi:hypothetical protein